MNPVEIANLKRLYDIPLVWTVPHCFPKRQTSSPSDQPQRSCRSQWMDHIKCLFDERTIWFTWQGVSLFIGSIFAEWIFLAGHFVKSQHIACKSQRFKVDSESNFHPKGSDLHADKPLILQAVNCPFFRVDSLKLNSFFTTYIARTELMPLNIIWILAINSLNCSLCCLTEEGISTWKSHK